MKRDEGEKLVLSFGKPAVSAASSSSSTTAGPSGPLKMNPLKGGNALKMTNPLKANPLKRPNVFKQGSSSSKASEVKDTGSKRPMSAAEALILEEQQRKKRRMEREGQA